MQACRPRGCRGWHGFVRSVNPISTRSWGRLCPPHYYWHPRIFIPSYVHHIPRLVKWYELKNKYPKTITQCFQKATKLFLRPRAKSSSRSKIRACRPTVKKYTSNFEWHSYLKNQLNKTMTLSRLKLIYLPQNGKFTQKWQIHKHRSSCRYQNWNSTEYFCFASRRRLVASSLGFTQPAIRLAQLESFQLSWGT